MFIMVNFIIVSDVEDILLVYNKMAVISLAHSDGTPVSIFPVYDPMKSMHVILEDISWILIILSKADEQDYLRTQDRLIESLRKAPRLLGTSSHHANTTTNSLLDLGYLLRIDHSCPFSTDYNSHLEH